MPFVTTRDGTEIFYKDWGPKDAQPIHFHHAWPLEAPMIRDNQMLFFLKEGFRVVAHDRRGHGRSSQVKDGHDMDHYAADAGGRRTPRSSERHPYRPIVGGGRSRHIAAARGQPQGRVAKGVLVSAVPPLMVKTASNPEGTPIEVFDGFRAALAANRAQFFIDVLRGPVLRLQLVQAPPSQGVIG